MIDTDFAALCARIARLGGEPPAPIELPAFDNEDFAAEMRRVATSSPRDIVRDAASRHGVDPALAEAVAHQESGFDPAATSNAGAEGIMQLMPDTARALGVAHPYDARENADGGVRYLREMLVRFGGDARLALAAYNAGPGAVERFRGIPPYAQTIAYVRDVLAAYHVFRTRDARANP